MRIVVFLGKSMLCNKEYLWVRSFGHLLCNRAKTGGSLQTRNLVHWKKIQISGDILQLRPDAGKAGLYTKFFCPPMVPGESLLRLKRVSGRLCRSGISLAS